jgi:hypothetical protein
MNARDPRSPVLRVAGAHALVSSAAAASVSLLATRASANTVTLLSCRGIRRRLRPVRIEGGEDPHVPLASASTAASHRTEPQLLPW